MEGGSKMGNGKLPSAPKDDLESDDEKTFSNVNFDSVGEYNDYIRRRRRKKKLLLGSGSPSNEETELEPLSPDMKSKLLDFEDMKHEETDLKPMSLPVPVPPPLPPQPEIVLTNNLDDKSKEKKKSDYKRAPRMNTFVGFLRLANYINASCVIFGVIASILMKEDQHIKPLSEADLDLEDFHDGVRHFVYITSGWVQISYLCVISLLTMIDAIGTVTFRWKEYGELSHSQTDATSVIFFLCKSRWTWRFGCGLSLASSISLATSMVMKEASNRDNFKSVPLNPLWFVALSTISVASSLIGWLLSLFPWHGVSWLYDHFKMKHVEDKGDIWIKTWGRQISAIYEGGQVTTKTPKQQNVPESWMAFVDVLALVSFFSTYTLAIGIYVFSIIIMPKRLVADLDLWTVIVSALSSILISLYALIFILINLIRVSGK